VLGTRWNSAETTLIVDLPGKPIVGETQGPGSPLAPPFFPGTQ
jgi:hypothetical protein